MITSRLFRRSIGLLTNKLTDVLGVTKHLFLNGTDQYVAMPSFTSQGVNFEVSVNIIAASNPASAEILADGLSINASGNPVFAYTDEAAASQSCTLASVTLAAGESYTLTVSSDGNGVTLSDGTNSDNNPAVIDPTTINIDTWGANSARDGGFFNGRIGPVEFTDSSGSRRYLAQQPPDGEFISDSLSSDGIPENWPANVHDLSQISPIVNVVDLGEGVTRAEGTGVSGEHYLRNAALFDWEGAELSVDVKMVEHRYVGLRLQSPNALVMFDLLNGVVSSGGSRSVYSITPLTDGYYNIKLKYIGPIEFPSINLTGATNFFSNTVPNGDGVLFRNPVLKRFYKTAQVIGFDQDSYQ